MMNSTALLPSRDDIEIDMDETGTELVYNGGV